MKISTLFAAAISALVLPSALSAQNYIEEYSNELVPVKQQVGAQLKDMELIGIIDGALEMKPAGNSPVVIATPLEDIKRIQLIYEYPSRFNDARNHLLAREYEAAVRILRPMAYPLVRFMQVPNEQLNIHEMVYSLLDGLVNAGLIDEARAVVAQLPLESLRPDFMVLAVRTAEQLIEQGAGLEALALLNKIPFNENTAQFFPLFQQFAGSLRENKNYEEALFFYQRLAGQSDYATFSKLWIAYINVELSRVETATVFLEEIGELARNRPEFSLKRLVETKIALKENNLERAKEAISQAVVFSDIGSEWSPEVHYLDGRVYELLGNTKVARDVYLQVALLFPSSQWAEQGNERIKELPAPSETSSEQGFSKAEKTTDEFESQAEALMQE